jgi:catechol 2,3-dioxygenase-like lactoylglutathione lyase family enzyme
LGLQQGWRQLDLQVIPATHLATHEDLTMLSYITVGANDLDRSGRFYDAALAPLGLVRTKTTDREIGYGPRDASGGAAKSRFWIIRPFNGLPATWGNGVDVAFEAASRAAVDAFQAAALAAGGSDEGAPGLRPQYHASFYTAYVRDPDGNKLNAVFED